MFADEIRRAAEAAPCVKLPDVAALLWRAYGAGQVTEAEAETLSALIEARWMKSTTVADLTSPDPGGSNAEMAAAA